MNQSSQATLLRKKGYAGFTLLELMVAISIAGMLLAASIPVSVRFYESMQYRQAIRDVVTMLATARYTALNTGKAQDITLNPETNVLRLNKGARQLPEKFNIVIHTARELNRDSEGVIRFYPEGGSSGGDIDMALPNGSGVKISVDWLVGSVTQEKYAFEEF
jgi:general secretion pathway protein H